MILRQGLVLTSLLAIVLPAYAAPNDVTLDLNGVVTSVLNDTDNAFAVGQPVSGSILFDFSKETFPPGPTDSPNTSLFQGFGSYSLNIGPVKFTSNNISFALVDGGPGQADQLNLVDMEPFASSNPAHSYFDDIVISLFDPDGTGFTAGGASFDPSKFTVGTFDASSADPFFTGGIVTGPITADAARGRPVPEPPIALLLFTGMAGLIGWQSLRRRAKAQLATTSLA